MADIRAVPVDAISFREQRIIPGHSVIFEGCPCGEGHRRTPAEARRLQARAARMQPVQLAEGRLTITIEPLHALLHGLAY